MAENQIVGLFSLFFHLENVKERWESNLVMVGEFPPRPNKMAHQHMDFVLKGLNHEDITIIYRSHPRECIAFFFCSVLQ